MFKNENDDLRRHARHTLGKILARSTEKRQAPVEILSNVMCIDNGHIFEKDLKSANFLVKMLRTKPSTYHG